MLRFYRSYFFIGSIINLLFAKAVWTNGMSILAIIVPAKFLLNLIFLFFINDYKKAEFNYYRNLGIIKQQLLWTVLLLDSAGFLTLMITASLLR